MRVVHLLPIALEKQLAIKNRNIAVIQQNGELFAYNNGILDYYNVFFEEYSRKDNRTICNILNKASSNAGGFLDAVLIQGHANKYMMALDQRTALSKFSFQSGQLASCFQKFVKDSAPIFLKGCDAGNRNGDNSTELSLAEVVAEKTGHSVYAPLQYLRDSECFFHLAPTNNVSFSCIKTSHYSTDLPGMKFGEYVRRFDPMNYQQEERSHCIQ